MLVCFGAGNGGACLGIDSEIRALVYLFSRVILGVYFYFFLLFQEVKLHWRLSILLKSHL